MIVTAGAMRRAVEQLLQANLPAFLRDMAPVEGVQLPDVVTWSRLPDFALIAENQSPAVIVTSPGVASIERGEFAQLRTDVAEWDVRVFVVVRGRTFEETADRVAAYTAAVRAVLRNARALPGLATGCRWTAERYTELSTDQGRTVGAGSVTVTYTGVQTDSAT